MSRVFISYSRSDLAFVEAHLLGVCRDAGLDPWYDKQEIVGAEQWERCILHALKASQWLLLVMSPDSAQSEWVKDELQVAIGEIGIPVLPLMWKDCKPTEFHLRLSRLQYIDFRPDIPLACQQLAHRLSGIDKPSRAPEMDTTSELITIAASLLARQELKHLRNLARGETKGYIGRRSMRHEIRHLCDLGLLVRKGDRQIGGMKDGEECDLADVVELSKVGGIIAARLPGVPASR